MATITLDREAYLEYRCFGMPDEYPKDMRDAVSEVRRRGYDASIAKLQYMIETEEVVPETDRWTEQDIDAAAEVLAENDDFAQQAIYFLYLGVDAKEYFKTLHEAWDKVRDEFGDAVVPINPVEDYLVMTVHPPRMSRDGYVEFELCDDIRQYLTEQRAACRDMKGLRMPAEERRRGK